MTTSIASQTMARYLEAARAREAGLQQADDERRTAVEVDLVAWEAAPEGLRARIMTQPAQFLLGP